MSKLIGKSRHMRRWLAAMVILGILAGCGGGVAPQPPAGPVATSAPAPAQATPAPGEVLLSKQGFGQQGRIVSIGFLVASPHAEALSAIPYTAQVFDAGGSVLQTASGEIDLLLPKQESGIFTEVAVPQQAQVARVEVKLKAGTPLSLERPLEVLRVNTPSYGANPEVPGGHPVAVGVITNPTQEPVEDLLVTALLLDQAGNIIGAGSTMVDLILASEQAGFQAQVITSAEYQRVTTYVAYTKGSIGQAPTPPRPPSNASAALPGEKIDELEAEHVSYSTRVKYNSTPPTSGPHWEAWAAWGVFTDTSPFDEQMVHNLEHGGVIISYNPDKISAEQFDRLFELYREFKQINYRFILTARKDLSSPVAMTSWGYLQTFDDVDREAMAAFAIAHIAQGPECSGGECAP